MQRKFSSIMAPTGRKFFLPNFHFCFLSFTAQLLQLMLQLCKKLRMFIIEYQTILISVASLQCKVAFRSLETLFLKIFTFTLLRTCLVRQHIWRLNCRFSVCKPFSFVLNIVLHYCCIKFKKAQNKFLPLFFYRFK